MKILSLTADFQKDLTNSGIKLKQATASGYGIAARSAQIYQLGNVHKYLNIARSVGDKIIKSTSRKEIPYIAGAIGLLTPLPLACPVLMGIGFLFRFCTADTKMNKNQRKNLSTNA